MASQEKFISPSCVMFSFSYFLSSAASALSVMGATSYPAFTYINFSTKNFLTSIIMPYYIC